MAGSYSKTIIIGNLGADPIVKQFQNGGQVCNLSVATSESWKDKNTGERKERVEWHNVVIQSEGLVRIAQQYLKKGSKVLIEGKNRTRSYEKDGVTRYTTEIAVGFDGTLTMLDSAGGSGGNNRSGDYQHDQSRPETPQDFNQDFGDEVPF